MPACGPSRARLPGSNTHQDPAIPCRRITERGQFRRSLAKLLNPKPFMGNCMDLFSRATFSRVSLGCYSSLAAVSARAVVWW